LALEAESFIIAEDMMRTLRTVCTLGGEPTFIRSDNGLEFRTEVVKRWLAASGVKTLYVEPSSPQESAYSET
jgi:hypothetical protein